jgi:hypothetical protein
VGGLLDQAVGDFARHAVVLPWRLADPVSDCADGDGGRGDGLLGRGGAVADGLGGAAQDWAPVREAFSLDLCELLGERSHPLLDGLDLGAALHRALGDPVLQPDGCAAAPEPEPVSTAVPAADEAATTPLVGPGGAECAGVALDLGLSGWSMEGQNSLQKLAALLDPARNGGQCEPT